MTLRDPIESGVGARRICLTCIGDVALRARLSRDSTRGTCHYCDKRRTGVTMTTLAEAVDEPLRAYCVQGGEVRRYTAHSDESWWDQEGSELYELLQYELEIEDDAATDLASYLEDHDPAWPPDGEEKFYDSGQRYHRAPARYIGGGRYQSLWGDFATRITHERRFFDAGATQRLEQILGARGDAKAQSLPLLEVGTEAVQRRLYRARIATSEADAREMLAAPATQVGPPPCERASAGRMNPAGISVFYGALDPHTALAEVRPYVGGLVVVAQFEPTRVLRLLDLTQLGTGYTGSIFADEYEDRVSRRHFLRGFHALIARPVRPGDEHTAYVPTQAVAEYVGNVLGFDGILYGSVQVGALDLSERDEEDDEVFTGPPPDDEPKTLEKHNVVLLGPSGRVETEEGTQTDAATNAPSPGLRYVPESARAHRVTLIGFEFEDTGLHVNVSTELASAHDDEIELDF